MKIIIIATVLLFAAPYLINAQNTTNPAPAPVVANCTQQMTIPISQCFIPLNDTVACAEYDTCFLSSDGDCAGYDSDQLCAANGETWCCDAGNPPVWVNGTCQCFPLSCEPQAASPFVCVQNVTASGGATNACVEFETCNNVTLGETACDPTIDNVCSIGATVSCCPENVLPVLIGGVCQCLPNATLYTTGSSSSSTTNSGGSTTNGSNAPTPAGAPTPAASAPTPASSAPTPSQSATPTPAGTTPASSAAQIVVSLFIVVCFAFAAVM